MFGNAVSMTKPFEKTCTSVSFYLNCRKMKSRVVMITIIIQTLMIRQSSQIPWVCVCLSGCMHIYLFMCICICLSVYFCECVCVFLFTFIFILSAYLCISTGACVPLFLHLIYSLSFLFLYHLPSSSRWCGPWFPESNLGSERRRCVHPGTRRRSSWWPRS